MSQISVSGACNVLCMYLDSMVGELGESVNGFDFTVKETSIGSEATLKTRGYSSNIVRVSSSTGALYFVKKEGIPFLENLVPYDSTLKGYITNLILACLREYPPSGGFKLRYNSRKGLLYVNPLKVIL